MNFTDIKLPIAVIGIIVAQAFGIIWYVATLDSTVRSLDNSVAEIQMSMTDTSIAVLETNVQNMEQSLWEINDKIRQLSDNPIVSEHWHSECNNIRDPISLDGVYAELQIIKEGLQDRKQEGKDLEWRIAELEKVLAVVENEMRTIMSDHMVINDTLRNLGQSGYADNREYGNYD